MLRRCLIEWRRPALLAVALVGGLTLLRPSVVDAFESLGIGTEFLIGGDLTDPEDDGNPESDIGYNALFYANDEPGFGGGEFAFNVFDNVVGGGNDKWCCGKAGGISEDDPIWVAAQLPARHFLTNFTVSSANDTPDRDPTHWAIQGSNDGTNYTDIYVYNEEFESPWFDRLEVIEWKAGTDFPVQTTSYEFFRMATYNTNLNPSGAYFQIGEIEFFGTQDGGLLPLFIAGENAIGVRTLPSVQSNLVFNQELTGATGWFVDLVDASITIDNHTRAESVLNDASQDHVTDSYALVDLGGGAGTFFEDMAYPNGVGPGDTSMEDFAVRASAKVTIPAGTWTVGFGSDDGGQLTISGVSFTDSLNNNSATDDQIRFEGNRGHGWTVGTFTLTEPLETEIIASMHERGGGDSFEVALINDEAVEAADPNLGWELLGDGVFGWEVDGLKVQLASADLTADGTLDRPYQFDVNGDTGEADQLSMDNPDPAIYTTTMNLGDVTFQIKSSGSVSSGEAFQIVNADVITGNVTLQSVNAGQNWVFDAATGRVCLDSCPGAGPAGDYNNDGMVDAGDIDAQAVAMQTPTQNLDVFDENGDGTINVADREIWVKNHANGGKGTWIGDADLNGLFNSSDFVTVFLAGKYESGENAGWGEGDWDGDLKFGSGDFVAAFLDGGYEAGELPAAVAAVPEPNSCLLLVLGLAGLVGRCRRR